MNPEAGGVTGLGGIDQLPFCRKITKEGVPVAIPASFEIRDVGVP
jgi:hypothetical protein